MSLETIESAAGSSLFADRDSRVSFLTKRIRDSGQVMVRLSESASQIRTRARQQLEQGNHADGDQLIALCTRLHKRQALLQQRIELLQASLRQMEFKAQL